MTSETADKAAETGKETPARRVADTERIMALLPHRFPMLMIDRVEDLVFNESAKGIKNVTINEPFFQGHFPDHPVMPGVLIVEALAQTAGVLVMESLGTTRSDEVVYFMTIDKARFRRPVVPGDTLRLMVKVQRHRGPVWRFLGEAFVGETLAAEAAYSAMLVRPSVGATAPVGDAVDGSS